MGSEGRKHIALLIFALSPEAQHQQKNLGGEKGLYELLNQHTLKLAKTLGLPYFHFTEKEQEGKNFGERYTHAIKKIFSMGYDGIITIGNDTPALGNEQLQKAYKNLKTGKSVLGPSLDGGFYLLAIPKAVFSEEAFLSISWNSPQVFRQMQRYLQKRNESLCVLSALGDLDSLSDAVLLLDRYINIPYGIKKVLAKTRPNGEKITTLFASYYSIHGHNRILNRGSPLLPV
ncbi:MAG: DUF2064 domain-containing protein [Eudoraea sp.]|nr:DUF2064 domain-containing protein [Eudoraea sp.]